MILIEPPYRKLIKCFENHALKYINAISGRLTQMRHIEINPMFVRRRHSQTTLGH